jgi:hypothetical protein
MHLHLHILTPYSCLRKFALASACAVVAACGGGGGASQNGQTVTPVDTTLTIGVIDASTKAVITHTPFTLSYGDDAIAALTPNSVTQSSFTTSRLHTLRSELTPTSSTPVNLSMTLVGSGFLPSSKHVTVRQAGASTFLFEVISTAVDTQGRLTSNPIGVTGIKTNLPVAAGVVAPGPSPVSKTIDQQSYAGLAGPNTPSAAASLIMPVGTVLGTRGSSGFTATANSSLDLFMNTFSPYATESLSQFPSGMVGARIRNDSGVVQTVARIRIDAAVTIMAIGALLDHAGDFSLPLELAIDAPRSARDDADGEFSALGQTAQVYRFDASTGVWEPVAIASVTDLARGPDSVSLSFAASKTGTYAIFKRPAVCGLDLTMVRSATDRRALNVTVLTRGFLDGDIGLTGTSYRNPELPADAGAVYVTLPSGVKVGEVVLAKNSPTGTCPRQASVAIN